MRRLEQKELVQRLDNNESTGKAESADLSSKLKREQVGLESGSFSSKPIEHQN